FEVLLARIDPLFHVAQHILGDIARRFRIHAGIDADRVADGLAVDLGLGEKRLSLPSNSKPESRQFRVPIECLTGLQQEQIFDERLGELLPWHRPTFHPSYFCTSVGSKWD